MDISSIQRMSYLDTIFSTQNVTIGYKEQLNRDLKATKRLETFRIRTEKRTVAEHRPSVLYEI